MPRYTAYNLHIQTDVPLVGLSEGSGSPDVIVRTRELLPHELEELATDDQLCWGSVHGLARFIVREGVEITVDPHEALSRELLGSFVSGVLMAILLRQRGLFTLHASCVAKDGVAIGFAGKSGWGKSTLAEYFYQQGYQLLCDDLLALQIQEGRSPVVVPGYPHIRLTEEAGTHFVEGFESMPLLFSHGDKRFHAVESHGEGIVTLRRLYLLDDASAPETRVEPLTSGEAFREIPEHAWATNTIADAQSKATYLRQCAALIKSVPVSYLRRVRTLDSLPEHFEAVERHLETAGVGT